MKIINNIIFLSILFSAIYEQAMESSKRPAFISLSSRRKKMKTDSVVHKSLFEQCPRDVQQLILEKLATLPCRSMRIFKSDSRNHWYRETQNLHAIRQVRLVNRHFRDLVNSTDAAKKVIAAAFRQLRSYAFSKSEREEKLLKYLFKIPPISLLQWIAIRDAKRTETDLLAKYIQKNECGKVAQMIEGGLGNDYDEYQLYITEALVIAEIKLSKLQDDFYEKMVQSKLGMKLFGISLARFSPQWGKNVISTKKIMQLLLMAKAKNNLHEIEEKFWSLRIPDDILQSIEIEKHLETIDRICISHRHRDNCKYTK